MKNYFDAPEWDETVPRKECPSTCKTAQPAKSVTVHNRVIIDAKHVNYRDASFAGKFVLAESVKLPLPETGWHKVEVYCLWFGHRLKTRGPKFSIDMSTAKLWVDRPCQVTINLAK